MVTLIDSIMPRTETSLAEPNMADVIHHNIARIDVPGGNPLPSSSA